MNEYRLSTRKLVAIVAAATAAAVAVAAAILALSGAYSPSSHSMGKSESAGGSPYVSLTAGELAALPEARYDAVIPGLQPFAPSKASATASFTLKKDTPIYDETRQKAVARFAVTNFMNERTVVVPVEYRGSWALVLTPSRKTLPSATSGGAAAQTVGWIRRDALHGRMPLANHVVVSVSARTLRIVSTAGATLSEFPVGVGTSTTPTPTGVVGYLQARYLDAKQGQTVHPIQLTSLHSAAADRPYGNAPGGLIGVHYQAASTGAVSHGCIRLDADAIAAVNALPLGTLVQITS
jgi:lipoprotein-anchoring transpeptidase ErfK/SrfK